MIDQRADAAARRAEEQLGELDRLVAENDRIHARECFNLDPAANVMNPRAEAMMSAHLGSRPSLGRPGEKYETGLEAIEEIEVIAAELCAQVFGATFVEHRVASGSMANLYAFMATCEPGDAIIVPPPEVGGHVTHHEAGAAGLHGLVIHHAPAAGQGYTVDLDGLAALGHHLDRAHQSNQQLPFGRSRIFIPSSRGRVTPRDLQDLGG